MNGLLRSEFRKILTTRLWWGLLIGLVVTWAGLAVLQGTVIAGNEFGGQKGPALDDPATARSVYTAGLGIAYLFALAFGIIAMAGEYRHQTITVTVLGSPRRSRVVVAKLGAVTVAGLCYGAAGVLSGLAVGVPVFLVRNGSPNLGGDGVVRALLTATLAVALWAVVGLGVGTLLRNQVVALLVAIGVAWIVEPIVAAILSATGVGSVSRFFPSMATSALVSPPPTTGNGLDVQLLPWWGGVLVLLGYAAFSGGLGAALTLRRDIT